MFDIVDTAFNYGKELIVCSFLQDFSEEKGSSLQFLLCGVEYPKRVSARSDQLNKHYGLWAICTQLSSVSGALLVTGGAKKLKSDFICRILNRQQDDYSTKTVFRKRSSETPFHHG